jgi:hypothetical protein
MSQDRYALFKKLPNGAPYWVAFSDDLALLTRQMHDLAARETVACFIQDLEIGATVEAVASGGKVRKRRTRTEPG